MALNSIPKRMGNKEKYLLYLKNLSISLVVNFLCKGHSKNKFDAFSKIKNIKLHTKSTEIGPLMLGVSLLLDNLRKRIFMN